VPESQKYDEEAMEVETGEYKQRTNCEFPSTSTNLGKIFQITEAKTASGSKFVKFVESTTFDVITAVLVVLCVIAMALEVEYEGMQAGYVLQLPGFDVPAAQVWQHGKEIFATADTVFNILFTFELILRLAASRWKAISNCWIHFDASLILLSWISILGGGTLGFNPTVFRLARILRLGRVLKLLRHARIVQTLFLLIKSIQASIGCLVWSFAVLWFFQVVMAILMSQVLHPEILDDSRVMETRRSLFSYFGTFTRGTLTMFEVTLGNWVPSCRLLYDNVSGWFGLVYILYRCCFMFAIVRVITAVFIAETTRCANNDDELALQKKHVQKEQYCAKLKEVFVNLDRNGDGVMSWDEFEPLVTNSKLKTWLATLEIDTHDLMTLYKIYSQGHGMFDINRFIDGMSHVRGPAKSIDVLKLTMSVQALNEKIDAILMKQAHQEVVSY